ncbi:L-serine ammonia-lyase [Actinomyces vulturis]|uniref:L-serine ammonia-lyase n=1 Tax=Actinomyces vulturis TaxID=1857645 RepID=UPI000832A4AC|nr:L-serine ammonia-lyase [Actinomyces vulturis]
MTQVREGASPAALVAGEITPEEAPRPLSVFDLMRIGIGPSSSHTVGPMRAGMAFGGAIVRRLGNIEARGEDVPTVARIIIELYGSLGATGRGHATDRAVIMGLAGYQPETVPTEVCQNLMEEVEANAQLTIPDLGDINFLPSRDIIFLPGKILPYHVNGMTLAALDECGNDVLRRSYYSVGGGFVMEDVGEDGTASIRALATTAAAAAHATQAPFPFSTGAELLKTCERTGLRISDVVMANEVSARTEEEVVDYLDLLRGTMSSCIEAGCTTEGTLPGGLGVQRRAKALHDRLRALGTGPASSFTMADPLRGMDWVDLFALAVNEENAAGHRVVTAPTNGAAGIVPAVLAYYERFIPGANEEGAHRFLLAATAVGSLIKTNASIAGAEVGCQGEVGSASSMAAAGLAEALGGSPAQVENAAEIAMEHNLGLTCDPVGGLVQIPCIERNAVAAVKAINAARMALWGEGRHAVSLDQVIETMRQTGEDMLAKYKETSRGGLAVNVVEC